MTNTVNPTLSRINEIVSKNQSGAIIVPSNATIDNVAAATALYLALSQLNKTVNLACSTNVNFDLTASDKFQTKLATGGDNLVISLPYVEGSIDKVDYNIEGEFFNLIISPRAGFAKFNSDQVKYSYTGGMVNFILVLDSPTLNSLGAIYNDNKPQFQGRDIINIDRHLTNANFGTVNHIDKTASSVSELALDIIRSLNVEIDKDIATNLYAGIAAATNNFTSYSVNAKTFESVAFLLRQGALKKLLKKPTTPMNTGYMPSNMPQPPSFSQSMPTSLPSMQSNMRPQQPKPKMQVMTSSEKHVRPVEEVEKLDDDENNPPTDWLKPKIFKGGGLME